MLKNMTTVISQKVDENSNETSIQHDMLHFLTVQCLSSPEQVQVCNITILTIRIKV